MTASELRSLAVRTLTDPRGAAQDIQALGLAMQTRWQIVGLMAVLTAAITGLSLIVSPSAMELPPFFANPILMAGFVAASIVGVAWVAGLFAPVLGGQGDWRELMLLFAWVQALRIAAQLILTVLAVLPGGAFLGALLGLAASVAGVWISVMFTTEAMRLSSGWKGFLLLAVSGLGFVLLLAVFWAIIGPTPEGFPENV